ncbi:AcrR family transcriptional regulator [Marmoricola sp. OAE513]|uniref:TetR/AcrR family transcriptional regulator n=1 Tax=Marmoricola sp. OAE513 TaxID=2817894 RepID=UPI001AE22AC3
MTATVPLSAKGTRLNKRGLETRQVLLRTALECLAEGGAESVSASLIAREAGVTWGTVQHQFGDVDGLWAAVLEHVLHDTSTMRPRLPDSPELASRVTAIVEMLWTAMDLRTSRAIHNLRLALPRQRDELESEYPATAAAIAHFDTAWTDLVGHAFDGFDLDPVRLARVRSLLPGAMRGLHSEQYLSTYTDPAEARTGLAEAITSYLQST